MKKKDWYGWDEGEPQSEQELEAERWQEEVLAAGYTVKEVPGGLKIWIWADGVCLRPEKAPAQVKASVTMGGQPRSGEGGGSMRYNGSKEGVYERR